MFEIEQEIKKCNNKNKLLGLGELVYKCSDGEVVIKEYIPPGGSIDKKLMVMIPDFVTHIDGAIFAGIKNDIEIVYNGDKIDDMESMFAYCDSRCIDLRRFNARNVISARRLFYFCDKLENLGLCGFNSIKDAYEMFHSCNRLKIVDTSKFAGTKLNNVYSIFKGCTELMEADFTDIDLSGVTSIERMFMGCNNIERIWLTGVRADAGGKNNALDDCWNLKELHIEWLNTASNGNGTGINYIRLLQDCCSLEVLYTNQLSGLQACDIEYVSTYFTQLKQIHITDKEWYDTEVIEKCNSVGIKIIKDK